MDGYVPGAEPFGDDEMLATIAAGAKRGITMSTIGFGMGNYKDDAMEQLANRDHRRHRSDSAPRAEQPVRESPYAAHLNLEWVEKVATPAIAGKSDRAQLIELIAQAKALR